MFGGFGIWEALLILALILLFFGGKNIPKLAKGLGSAIRNFKGELDRPERAEEEEPREIPRGEDPRER